MNIDSTYESIENYLAPFMDSHGLQNQYIIMDNTTSHASEETQDFMKRNSLKCIPLDGRLSNKKGGYPPNSPDFNAVEFVSSFWKDTVAKIQPNNVTELIQN